MSIKYMDRVWHLKELKGGKLLIMLALADHANDAGECWPSQPHLAEKARLTDRQIRRVVAALVADGILSIIEKGVGRGKKTHYQLFPDAIKADILSEQKRTFCPDKAIKADISDNKSGHFVHVKADISDASQSHVRSEPSVKEPSIEPSVKESTAYPADVEFVPDTKTPPKEKILTPQQAMYGAICEALGWDYHAIAETDQVRVAQAVKILSKAEYTVEDIRRFMVEIWFRDWRWEKHEQRPTLNQLRQEIGKLRAGVPENVPRNGNQPTSKAERNAANVHSVFDRIRNQEAQNE